MEKNYKIDIFEKFLDFFSLFYLVCGILTSYALICKKIDTLSSSADIESFWSPIPGVMGSLNIINFVAIIICLKCNERFSKDVPLLNEESNFIFYILSTPLFFITIFDLCWVFILKCNNIEKGDITQMFMVIGESLLFCGTMFLTEHLRKATLNGNTFQCRVNRFVLRMTLFGVINYGLYHIVNQQTKIFIETASDEPLFRLYYRNDSKFVIKNKNLFGRVQNYAEPITSMFCCVCAVQIISLIFENNEEIRKHQAIEETIQNKGKDTPSGEIEIICRNPRLSSKLFCIKLPPIALLLGVMFLCINIVMIFLIVVETDDNSNEYSQKSGKMIMLSFPIPIYAISIPFLCLQINAMKSWPKLKVNKNVVDQCLAWIGNVGLLILAATEINVHTNLHKSNILILVFYFWLILHCIFQYVTIMLALDREWKVSEINSWNSYMCPTFAMFSINMGFLIFTLYNFRQENGIGSFEMRTEKRFYLKLFGNGFYSAGVTLTLIARLQSSIIFGKMSQWIS